MRNECNYSSTSLTIHHVNRIFSVIVWGTEFYYETCISLFIQIFFSAVSLDLNWWMRKCVFLYCNSCSELFCIFLKTFHIIYIVNYIYFVSRKGSQTFTFLFIKEIKCFLKIFKEFLVYFDRVCTVTVQSYIVSISVCVSFCVADVWVEEQL